MTLTKRQLDAAVAIRNFIALYGFAPTISELGRQLGTGRIAAQELVTTLVKKGIVRRDRQLARGISLIPERLPDEWRSTKIPVLGVIAQGSPIQLLSRRAEVDLEQLAGDTDGCYVLTVSGEGFSSYHVSGGDRLIISRIADARFGQIVIVLNEGGGAWMKKWAGWTPHEKLIGAVLGMLRRAA